MTTKTTAPFPPTLTPAPAFRVLCVMTHYVLDRLAPDAAPSDIIDELKWDLARARMQYPRPEHFAAVVDAVTLARSKGYLTPRGRP
jgi:hypothetical protein